MEKIIIESKETPEFVFIWLHGLGASGHDLKPLAEKIPITWSESIKHLLPHAPESPVTINNNMCMPSWYDIYTLSADVTHNLQRIDFDGIKKSAESINEMIQIELKQGIDISQIYLIGFSQGGVICNYIGITSQWQLGGIIGLSTYLPFDENYFQTNEFNQNNSFFIAHGQQDSVIPFNIGKKTFEILDKNKFDVTFQEYNMDHGICEEEYIDMATWLKVRQKKIAGIIT